jgi:hypothetical protein
MAFLKTDETATSFEASSFSVADEVISHSSGSHSFTLVEDHLKFVKSLGFSKMASTSDWPFLPRCSERNHLLLDFNCQTSFYFFLSPVSNSSIDSKK